jgi:enolase
MTDKVSSKIKTYGFDLFQTNEETIERGKAYGFNNNIMYSNTSLDQT